MSKNTAPDSVDVGQLDEPSVDNENFKLPEIESDAAGIPTFVFQQGLSEGDKPTAERKVLEVVLLWRDTVLSVQHYKEPRRVTVGENLKNDFRISCNVLPSDSYPLIDVDGDGFVINWTEEMALEVKDEAGDILDRDMLAERRLAKKAERGFQYRLRLHDRVAVQIEGITFVIQYVSPARLIQSSLLKTIDFYFTRILGFSFLAHAFVIIALLLTPPDPYGLREDLFKNPNRFAQLILKPQEKKPLPKKRFELSGSKGGAKHKDKEGKFGKPDKPKKDALASAKGAPRVDPNKREKDRKIAFESGLLKALSGKQGAVSNVLGPGGLGTGINKALGGLRGSEHGDAGGALGLGTRGTGPGGGGNSLGIGGLGDGTGYGTGGLGNVDLGGRGKSPYKVEVGRTVTKGCLTQNVVLRVLNRVQSQAKYCYEKELPRNPNLEGKVTTAFVIGPTGAVQDARIAESTMNNANVESCLTRIIKRLRFPPCAGGGVAEVTYPWIFKSGGAR